MGELGEGAMLDFASSVGSKWERGNEGFVFSGAHDFSASTDQLMPKIEIREERLFSPERVARLVIFHHAAIGRDFAST